MSGPVHNSGSGEDPPPRDPWARIEWAKRRAEALQRRAERVTKPAMGARYATLPCPDCEGVNRFPLSDPPLPARCSRCGGTIDPTSAVPVRLRVLDAVLEGTDGAIVAVLSTAGHPLNALLPLLRPALQRSGGRLVTIVLDGTAEPEAAGRLGLPGAPGIAFFQDGGLMGALPLPAGLADLFSKRGGASGGPAAGAIDALLRGALGAGGLPLPFPFTPPGGGPSSPGGGER